MSIKRGVRKVIRKLGYDIVSFSVDSHHLARRMQILKCYKIGAVLDIGANIGQYAQELRSLGFKENILSFEPTSNALNKLKKTSKNDNNWEIFDFALGDKVESKSINIANNSYSSSLLSMLPRHLQSAPASKFIGSEDIKVKTIDSIWNDLKLGDSNVYMKMDVQGFEKQVLQGSSKSLKYISTIQMEMSLVSLYEGETLFQEMLSIMKNYGYTLIALEPGFSDKKTGQLLQVDGIFHRFGGMTS